jgi:ADP-ribose pyrophosphatase
MKKQANPWQLKSSRILLDHPRIRIVEDDLELPEGQEISWLRYENLRDFVVIIAIQDNKIVLIQHYNHPLEGYLYEFPCGMIDEGEVVADAAFRELLEETGFKAQRLERLGQFVANPRRTNLRGHVVFATDLKKGETSLELGEMIEVSQLELGQFEAQLKEGLEMSADALAAWSLCKLHLSDLS